MDNRRLAAVMLQLASENRLKFLSISGSSMYPFLKDRDIVEVIGVEADQLKIGDVVVCRVYRDHFVVHRIVEIIAADSDRWLSTKGDNNDKKDGYYIPVSLVIGKVGRVFNG